MYNRSLFLKIHIFSFFANNIIKFERTDFMEENFNSGKDENINLTILNEINKAAKMGMDSISYVLKKVGDENMKENLTELVAVRLFKDNDKYNSDVFVSVNCNNYLIRRGETVMVPLFIKKELDRAELQRKRAEYYRDEGWKQSLIVQEGK